MEKKVTEKVYMSISHEDERLIARIPGCITAEDYCKWYDLFIISSRGVVLGMSSVYSNWFDEIETCDHYYYPESIVRFALKFNLKIDYVSYAAICYRYLEDSGEELIPSDKLPLRQDLTKVLIDGKGDCEYFNIRRNYFSIEDCISKFSRKTVSSDVSEYVDKFSFRDIAKIIEDSDAVDVGPSIIDEAELLVLDDDCFDRQDYYEELLNWFGSDVLEICGCGVPEHTWILIRNFLRIMAKYDREFIKTHGCDVAYDAKWQELNSILGIEIRKNRVYNGMIQFLLYVLDECGLLEHGSSIYGAWITDLGKVFLQVLENSDLDQ